MKLAMPVWNDCISTVLDFSDCLLVVDSESGIIHNRSMVSFAGVTMMEKVARLRELGIQVLLCGALSRSMERMITASGIKIISFLRGNVNDVLNAYFEGRLFGPVFMLPGCPRRPGFGKGMERRRHGYGRPGWNNNRKGLHI
jgi:predicted Fe-Mo cluster-binding NifX family protein